MLADAQVARWQSKYGRDPTYQQRPWLVNKIRTDIAMIGTKLIERPGHHQEPPEHAREVTSAHGSARENGAGISGLDPPARQGTAHGRTQRPPSGVADVVELRDGQHLTLPGADSILTQWLDSR